MIYESVSIEQVLDVLNRATAKDPIAMAQLIDHRIWCNEELACDSTIQVQTDEHGYRVGVLGLINGILGVDDKDWGTIAASFEVICPKDCNHGQPKGVTTDSKCGECGSRLKSGQLLGFVDLKRR